MMHKSQSGPTCSDDKKIKQYKVKSWMTCYCTACMSQIHAQRGFTISELTADWDEVMIPYTAMKTHRILNYYLGKIILNNTLLSFLSLAVSTES